MGNINNQHAVSSLVPSSELSKRDIELYHSLAMFLLRRIFFEKMSKIKCGTSAHFSLSKEHVKPCRLVSVDSNVSFALLNVCHGPRPAASLPSKITLIFVFSNSEECRKKRLQLYKFYIYTILNKLHNISGFMCRTHIYLYSIIQTLFSGKLI